jgi:N-acetylglutamate synthase-like GNAT family acetyltransferase
MLDARGLISEEIKATGCCPSREMVVRKTWKGVDPPKLADEQILAIMHSISKDYIVSLECLLYRIFNAFKTKFKPGMSLRTDAACVDVYFTPHANEVVLKKISVRPCLQGLGIARMILNVILNACVEFQVDRFLVKQAYPSTEAILLSLGGFKVTCVHSCNKDYAIELKDMRKTLAGFEHGKELTEHDKHPGYFTIDPSRFPTSEKLNSQQAVEERCAKRSRPPLSLGGGMFQTPSHQEFNHTLQLDMHEFGKGFCSLLANLIKCVHSECNARWTFSCTALAFTCELRVADLESKRWLLISDLVFCDKAEKYRLAEMLIHTLVYLCRHWGERRFNLDIIDPLPPVSETLMHMDFPWNSSSDFELPVDRMLDVIVPGEIVATGCCLSRMEYRKNSKIKLPALDPAQILDYSRTISDEYISSLECLLYRLHLVFKTKNRQKLQLTTDAVCVTVHFLDNKKGILVEYIAVRPCLQGRGISTMILWLLMSRCVRFTVAKLTVVDAYPSSAALVTKLGDFEEKTNGLERSDYSIKLHSMRKKTLQACGLEERLKEHEDYPGYFVIDPSRFPSSEELNSQQAVEERCAKRSRTGA